MLFMISYKVSLPFKKKLSNQSMQLIKIIVQVKYRSSKTGTTFGIKLKMKNQRSKNP